MRSSLFLLFILLGQALAHAQQWESLTTAGQPTARHEAAFVAFDGKAYLIGGRRINPVDVFDPQHRSWTAKSVTPIELHHFQAVVYDDAIYLIGAMTGKWPTETPVERIVAYYPKSDDFKFLHAIPPSRRRGGAGAVLYDNKIYIVGGITNGHMDGYQPWLDMYDPKTGDWTPLANAPHARDHFQAVVHDHKLYSIAGRTTSQRTEQGFDLTVKPVDVYDLKSNRWLPVEQCPKLPTPRAGNMAMAWGDEVIVGGGESGTQTVAHNQIEAFDTRTQTWRSWPHLQRGRHGSGLAIIGDYVYTASGSGNRGGGPELTSIERLQLPDKTTEDTAHINTWHPTTISFRGPHTTELSTPNPFTDYRLLVTFTHKETKYVIRGFYAADGNAANSQAVAGDMWQVRFSPDRPGTWTYHASLRQGADIAIDDDPLAGTTIELANAEGQFVAIASAARGDSDVDFRKRGRLVAEGGYLRFEESGRHWIKGGADSPENLLAYADFDGTSRLAVEASDGEATASDTLHQYAAHVRDWRPSDPTWLNGKGKGLIGAVNYLSTQGINAIYFLTLNINGDGKDVWPYASPDEFTRFDCSKLDQWEIAFAHMQARGILLHIVTQETENERLLDGGDTGRLRKLYYRELIARFAHHPALIWNLGEENGPADFSPDGQTAEQQISMSNYLKQADPYNHPVVIHTHSTAAGKDEILPPLLGVRSLDGLSFQVNRPDAVHGEVKRWRDKARRSGQPWMISMDEIGPWHTGVVPDSVDADHDILRRHVLWGSLMAGASGVEWYFGAKFPHNDLTSENLRLRENMWTQTRHAIDFFDKYLPYWQMEPANGVVVANAASDELAGTFCFARHGSTYAVYVSQDYWGKHDRLRLNLGPDKEASFTIRWFDPLAGGKLQVGPIDHVLGSTDANVGTPPQQPSTSSSISNSISTATPSSPSESTRDWVALVRVE